jgi:hypothetical protein
MTTYNEIERGGQVYWWRVYGHRGGRTYEVGYPAEAGKGRAVIRRNINFWAIDEKKLLDELIGQL